MKTVERMFEGPVDVVGDIHGQFDALQELLKQLGYARDGAHSQGRKLIFVGDLVDRGPDSVGVVEQVRDMVLNGNAQCVLGNHELNILRDSRKHGNEWYFNDSDRPSKDQRVATGSEQAEIRDFFAKLPLALERDDLRVVHACWNDDSIEQMQKAAEGNWDVAAEYRRFRDDANSKLESSGLLEQYRKEKSKFDALVNYGSNDHRSHWPGVKMLRGYAAINEARQMDNPVAVLTSGEERAASEPFPAGGKFRFVNRIPWWNNYRDEQSVIIGHYWRLFDMGIENKPRATGIDLFGSAGPHQWLGARKNVYCVDFSVGGRANGHSHETCRLAAVRWPEAKLLFDNGEELQTDFSSG
jgi:hypothetical protein